MSRTSIIVLLLLICLATLTQWLKNKPDISDIFQNSASTNQPQYFLETFSMSDLNESGQIKFKMVGERLKHYADDSTVIKNANIIFVREDIPPWHVKFNKGHALSETLDEIQLSGNVVMQREAGPNHDSLVINAETLLLKPEAEYAQTNAPITLSSDISNIHAASLEADMKQGKWKLTNVKAHYED